MIIIIKINKPYKEGELIFKNEDHTIGNLLGRELQDHKNIIYAAYKIEHLLINTVTIDFKTNEVLSIQEILKNSIKKNINKFNLIMSKLKNT